MELRFITLLLVISFCGFVWKSRPVVSAWFKAQRQGTPISFWKIWRMYFQNLPLQSVVDACATARAAGVDIELDEIVGHAQTGGDICSVVHAYIEMLRAGSHVDFLRVCEIDSETP